MRPECAAAVAVSVAVVADTIESAPEIKPAVEVTGPEKVVEAIALPHAQGLAVQSVHRQLGMLSARL